MTPKQFEQLVKRDIARLRRRVDAAVRKTARQAVKVIAQNVPVAFGELRDSIHAEQHEGPGHIASTVTDAPHAAAVEVGSRPHLVPLEDLVKWVKLRGMQGLTETGRVRTKRWRPEGTTTFEHARRVARQLKGMESGGALAVDAPEQIARAIQMAILKKGTKPHWYTAKSIPAIERLLEDNVNAALNKPLKRQVRVSSSPAAVVHEGVLEEPVAAAIDEMVGEVVDTSFPALPPASSD